MGFDEGRGKFCHLFLDLATGQVQRRATDRLRATAERADPLLDDGGVAVVDRDVLDRHPELVRQHLRERGLVALTVRRDPGGRADAAVASVAPASRTIHI